MDSPKALSGRVPSATSRQSAAVVRAPHGRRNSRARSPPCSGHICFVLSPDRETASSPAFDRTTDLVQMRRPL